MLTLIALIVALLFLSSPWSVVVVVAAILIDLAEIAVFVWWSRRRRRLGPPEVGLQTLLGRRGTAVARLTPGTLEDIGQVRVDGEIWGARTSVAVEPGASVVVRGVARSRARGRPGSRLARPLVEPSAMALLRLTLEYDGSAFHGWARQPGQRTVEGVLRDALDVIYPHGWDDLGVAGRTDTGVHATGQVASVTVTGGAPAVRAAEALNTALPSDVSIVGAVDAPEGFHARFSATARSYRYVVLNRSARSALEARRSLWWPRPVDLDRLEECAAFIVGEHEFTAFTPAESQHEVFVRIVREAMWERRGDYLHFTVTADSFLRHMVRTLVGTMLQASPSGLHASSRAGHGSRVGQPHRPGASTSSASSTRANGSWTCDLTVSTVISELRADLLVGHR